MPTAPGESATQVASADSARMPLTIVVAIACLSLAALGSSASLRVNDALLPRLAEEFSIDLGTAAQATSIFAVAYGVAQLFFGPMGERYGKYRVIGWGCMGAAVSSALCGFAWDFSTLRAMRALAGLSAAAIIPLSMAWIGDVVPYQSRHHVLARFLIGQIVGLSAGTWLGGYAADHWNWHVPYWALGVHFLLIGVAVLASNRTLPAHARATRPLGASALRGIASEFVQVLRVPWARAVLTCVFLEGIVLYGPFAFLAAHFSRSYGISLSAAGSMMMVYSLGGFAFAVASRHLVGSLGEAGLVRTGGSMLAASLLVLAFAPTWQWAVPSTFAAGMGFYMLHSTFQLNATQMAPERRGSALSSFAFCFFVGQSIGVYGSGIAVDRVGTRNVISCGAIALLVLSFAFARMRSRLPSPKAA